LCSALGKQASDLACDYTRRLRLQYTLAAVIAGLDPAIHLLREMCYSKKMDAREKPAHDVGRVRA
jgi:hypothetical protein